LFFTGKGGVGKTSMACASAIALADRGQRVLLVSTDPASNLDEVLGTVLSNRPTAIDFVKNLWAMNIDPEQAAQEYRERMVEPYRGVLPDAAVQSMEEQFSGSCTLEIAAFDEFAKLLGDEAVTANFDHIVFDTAPTGHTLRLLTLPSAWFGFMETNTSGTSCLGPLAGLQRQQAIYKQTVHSLRDAARTTIVLVTRPDASALREAERTSRELRELGVDHQELIVNGVFKAQDVTDEVAVAMQNRCDQAMAGMPAGLAGLPQTSVPLASQGLIGVDALRSVAQGVATIDTIEPAAADETVSADCLSRLLPLDVLIEQLAALKRGVILTMGKGGVGKTTMAAAVAVGLSERGFRVHLSTTDPAAHLTSALASDAFAGLTVSRIDPQQETEAYRDEVMRTAGANLDRHGKALLEEDLRSPCTEEIAVFRAFATAVAEGEGGFVVLDTAPTGHTILLLDSALAYHREVTRQSKQMPESVEKLLPRLRDAEYTRVLVVTLPESTPVHEAAHLQEDLRRAGIEPYAWVINQALSLLVVTDPVLRGRRRHEADFIEEVLNHHAERGVIVPWQLDPPAGAHGLRQLLSDSRAGYPAIQEKAKS
jgi:arsenite/tail-anchored protein-transporting ATPase